MKVIDASKLQQMVIGAYKYLEENKSIVDELNVFPVPDGDTGTNMNMTMKSGVDRVNQTSGLSVEEIAKALSQGTLMGARGNSGVILSQLVRGMSKTLKGKDEIRAEEVRDIFKNASKTAYRAVMQPTEGTILTVARKMAEKADEAFDESKDLDDYLVEIITEGQIALDNTPKQLPVLKEAGVVDSGGQGLIFLLRGALNALNGEIDRDIDLSAPGSQEEGSYKINFELLIKEDDFKNISDSIDSISTSFDYEYKDGHIKAEARSEHSQQIISKIMVDGVLVKLEIENTNPEVESSETKSENLKKYGFIAVSRGEGFEEILKSMNIDRIISGGQTMNPSTEDIYKNIEEINAENIIIFPNNKNIIMSSKQACELADKNVMVLETRSIPETFTAMLEFDEEEDIEENIKNMSESIADMHTVEVSISIRDTSVNNIEIKKDDYIGILDGKIVTTKSDIEQTTKEAIKIAIENDEDISLVTLYYGEETDKRKAKDLVKKLSKEYKDIDVELVYGGQPVYYYQATLE
ncbi:DAK2 domain-containing protein [uncultured Anaerococcus sp.]|uniref:DAK2 domain-containing protein n=1 Tax=uncultured Anaerococcus sp. TaxID=293428 RepID=UPI00288BCB75|nr:DAK2 domain-containing protein [uncultured Anaerococcus sp.]